MPSISADEMYRACDSRPKNSGLEMLHGFSNNNRWAVEGSSLAGCFYCTMIWEPATVDIKEYVDRDKEASDELGNATVRCPFCSIDSVLASIDVYPLTTELMLVMHEYWFTKSERV